MSHGNKTRLQLIEENKKLIQEKDWLSQINDNQTERIVQLEAQLGKNNQQMPVRLSQKTRVEKLKAGYALTLHGQSAKEFDSSVDSVVEAISKPITEIIEQSAAGSDFHVRVIVE